MLVFKEMFIANLKELVRDRAGMFWLVVFPVIFIFIFGIVFSGGGQQTFSVGIVSEGSTPVGNNIVENIKSISAFDVYAAGQSRGEELEALQQGHRDISIILPELNYSDFTGGKEINIPLYFDAGKKETNRVLISAVKQVFAGIEREITGSPKIFNIRTESLQARGISDFEYILPGILALALMQLGLFGSLQFLSLREQEIIRGLGVTPLRRSTILSSEIVVRLLVALVQTLLIVVIGYFIFDVRIVGGFFQVIPIVILGSLTFISMGYMLISFAGSMESGQGIIQVVQFPMMFLSGIFFPVDFMPDYIRPVVRAIPLTYLGDALRQVMIGATPNYLLKTDIMVLLGWLAGTLIVAVRFWRWE